MCRAVFALLAALSLSACQIAGRDGGTVVSRDVGIAGVYSPQSLISDHPHHVLMGHVIIVARDGEVVRALVIHQRRDGVHRLRYRQAWSRGLRLPYDATHRDGLGCTHGHCRDNQVGVIFLGERLFARALVEGLSARLVGGSGAIDIVAPPGLFTDAAARWAEM